MLVALPAWCPMPREGICLAWQLVPEVQLGRYFSNELCNESTAVTDELVGVLLAYAEDLTPLALTWLKPRTRGGFRRLKHEAQVINGYSCWWETHRDVGLCWTAAVWQFYSDWLNFVDVEHWRCNLLKNMRPDPLLDDLLAPTRGWLLWDYQLELVCEVLAAISTRGDAMLIQAAICAGDLEMLIGIRLPGGILLSQAIQERCRWQQHKPLLTQAPMYLAARISLL